MTTVKRGKNGEITHKRIGFNSFYKKADADKILYDKVTKEDLKQYIKKEGSVGSKMQILMELLNEDISPEFYRALILRRLGKINNPE